MKACGLRISSDGSGYRGREDNLLWACTLEHDIQTGHDQANATRARLRQLFLAGTGGKTWAVMGVSILDTCSDVGN